MLRLICGKTPKDDISNETIREIKGAENIEELLRVQRLRWFGYTEKMYDERAPVKAKIL